MYTENRLSRRDQDFSVCRISGTNMSMQKLCQKKRSSDTGCLINRVITGISRRFPVIWNLAAYEFTVWIWNTFPTFWELRVKSFLSFWALVQTSLGNATSVLFSTGFFLPEDCVFLVCQHCSEGERLVLGNLCQGVPSGFPQVLSAAPAQNLSSNKDKMIAIEAECLRIILGAKSVGKKPTLVSYALYNCIYVFIYF